MGAKTFCKKCHARVALAEARAGGVCTCSACGQSFTLGPDGRRVGVLRLLSGLDAGDTYYLEQSVTIGRNPACDIPLADPTASRQHARIACGPQGFSIKDLGSLHGTWVRDARVTEVGLHPKDSLRVGDSVFEFEMMDATTPNAGPPTVALDDGSGGFGTEIMRELKQDAALRFQPQGAAQSDAAYRAAYQRLETVYRVNEALSSIQDPDHLLERILDLVFSVLPAERAVILLGGADGAELSIRASKTRKGTSPDQLRLSRTVLKHVLDHRVSLLTTDALTDQRFDGAGSILAAGIRSGVVAPILYQDRMFGVMQVDSSAVGTRFTEDDLKMLTAIARQAAIALDNANLLRRTAEDARTRAVLERYLPASLVDQVVGATLDLGLGGTSKQLTVLFSDIRGFTSMSERLSAPEVVEVLNAYFEGMVDVVFKYGGTLDKFIGDCIMAFWGAPVERPDDPLKAVLCALEMQAQLAAFNQRRVAQGLRPVEMGCGINTGQAVVGNIGSTRRMDYTCIGDTVNLASRVQGLTGKGETFIAQGTYEAVRESVRVAELAPVSVKGKAQPVNVYKVLGAYASVSAATDRREEPRLTMAVPVMCTLSAGSRVPAVIVDASPHGMALILSMDLDLPVTTGESVSMTIGDKEFGGVVRNVTTAADAGGNPCHRVGVEMAPETGYLAAIDAARAAR